MKKLLLLLPLLPFLLLSCSLNKKIEIVARYENVFYNISKETGELTVYYEYQENDDVIIMNKEYKTMNYTYARYLTLDDNLSNIFFIRKNAPDLLVAYYH